jgi:hypothetical protein
MLPILVGVIFAAILASATSSSDDLKCVPLIKFANAHDAKLEVLSCGLTALVAQHEQLQSNSASASNIEVIAVVGGYRLGKSFLLNALTDGDAFPVGHTVNAHTTAMCGIVLSSGVLVLDSPGLFSPQSSEDRDAALVSFVMAISSAVLVLGDGAIDQRSVERLSLLIEFANKRAVAAAAAAATGAASPRRVLAQKPALVWVLRNMVLQLESANGTPLSASRYVTDTFAQTHARALGDYFAPVKGVALPYPVESTLELGPKMSRRRTSATYSAAINELRQLLDSVVEGKWRRHQAIIDKPMTIADFGTIAEFWTDELSSSYATNSTLFDSSSSIRAAFNEHVVRQALQILRSSFKERQQVAMNKVQLQAWYDTARVASVTHHARHVVGADVDVVLTTRFVEQLEHVFAKELSPQNELMVQQHIANTTSDALMTASARLAKLNTTLPKDEAILRAEAVAISSATTGQLQMLAREFDVDVDALVGARLESAIKGLLGDNERAPQYSCKKAWEAVANFNATKLPLRAETLRTSIEKLESDFEQQCLGPSQDVFGELKHKLIVEMPAFNDALAQQQLDSFFEWVLIVLAVLLLVSFLFLILLIDWTAAFKALSDLVDNFSNLTFGERLTKLWELFKKSVGRETIWTRFYFGTVGIIVIVVFGGMLIAHLWCVAPITSTVKSHVSGMIWSGMVGVAALVLMVIRRAPAAFMSPSPPAQRRWSFEKLSPSPPPNFSNESNDTTTTSESPSPSPYQSSSRRRSVKKT